MPDPSNLLPVVELAIDLIASGHPPGEVVSIALDRLELSPSLLMPVVHLELKHRQPSIKYSASEYLEQRLAGLQRVAEVLRR